MKNIKLSVIVPVYNEESRFKEGFNHYYSYLSKLDSAWELIFVNDGSTDRTLQILQKLAKKKVDIKIITYSKNQGKGFAIVQGVKKARGQYVLFSDLDHSVPIDTVEKFYKYFKDGYSVVIGSRRVKGAKFIKRQGLFRELLGRGFTLIVRIIIDWQIKDATCGFKAFENQISKKIFNKITVYDWAFDAELIFLCKKYNIKYAQAPVTWDDKRGSKVSLKRDVIRSLFGILKIRLNDLQSKY